MKNSVATGTADVIFIQDVHNPSQSHIVLDSYLQFHFRFFFGKNFDCAISVRIGRHKNHLGDFACFAFRIVTPPLCRFPINYTSPGDLSYQKTQEKQRFSIV